jgi:hypothetical protein
VLNLARERRPDVTGRDGLSGALAGPRLDAAHISQFGIAHLIKRHGSCARTELPWSDHQVGNVNRARAFGNGNDIRSNWKIS